MKRIGFSQEWVSSDKRDARRNAAEAHGPTTGGVQVRAALADTRLQTTLALPRCLLRGEALKLATLMSTTPMKSSRLPAPGWLRRRREQPRGACADGARGIAEDESAELRQQQSVALAQLERWVGSRADELAAPRRPAAAQRAGLRRHAPTVLALERESRWRGREASPPRPIASRTGPGESRMASGRATRTWSPWASASRSRSRPRERQDRDTAAKLALVDKAEAELAEARRAAAGEYRALASDAQRLQERIERYRSGVVAPAQPAHRGRARGVSLEPGEPRRPVRGAPRRGRRAAQAAALAARSRPTPGAARLQADCSAEAAP